MKKERENDSERERERVCNWKADSGVKKSEI